MMSAREVKEWMSTFGDESYLAVDDGGLRLVELDSYGEETGLYLEIGGVPLTEEEERGRGYLD